MTDEPNGIRHDLQTSIKGLTRATISLFLAVALVFGLGLYNAYHQRNELRQEVVRINASLCVFVNDLEQRVQASVQFLEENPEGIPGLSPALIRDSIANQRRTIDSLSGLECG